MPIKILKVRENAELGVLGDTTKTLLVQYMAGTHGPFTLITCQKDVDSGIAGQQMRDFAASIDRLASGY